MSDDYYKKVRDLLYSELDLSHANFVDDYIMQQNTEIERQRGQIASLKAAVEEAICHLSPEGCKAMNKAAKEASDNRQGGDA